MNITKVLELEKTQKLSGEWNGEKFSFSVLSNSLTPAVMQNFSDIKTNPIKLAEGLAKIVKSWDIDAGGETFPPTTENLSNLPVDFLNYLVEKIVATWSGDTGKKTKSASSSEA